MAGNAAGKTSANWLSSNFENGSRILNLGLALIKFAIYKIKGFVLHTLWAYGLVRSVWDDTKTHEVSAEVFYFKWPKKHWKGKRPKTVEIKDFPMRHAFPEISADMSIGLDGSYDTEEEARANLPDVDE